MVTQNSRLPRSRRAGAPQKPARPGGQTLRYFRTSAGVEPGACLYGAPQPGAKRRPRPKWLSRPKRPRALGKVQSSLNDSLHEAGARNASVFLGGGNLNNSSTGWSSLGTNRVRVASRDAHGRASVPANRTPFCSIPYRAGWENVTTWHHGAGSCFATTTLTISPSVGRKTSAPELVFADQNLSSWSSSVKSARCHPACSASRLSAITYARI